MKKGILGFVAVLVVIALVSVIAVSGLNLGITKIPSASEGVRLGLDLQGGAMITFEAETKDGSTPLEEDMESAQAVLRKRLDYSGYNEGSVQINGENRLIVEIPTGDKKMDPQQTVAILGQTAELTFNYATLDAEGNIMPGEVVLEGTDVEKAQAAFDAVDQTGTAKHHVILSLTSEGRAKFSEATKIAAAQKTQGTNIIFICLDGAPVSWPSVETQIDSDEAIITFGQTSIEEAANEAKELSNLINSGRLPFKLKEIENRTVGPTLGEKALETSLFAGMIGLILVMLFMIIIYRVPGIIASISLIFYTALMVVVMAILGVNLSLPGIAGIVLSIGMAVDANVIIYERIKEELSVGKTLRAAIDSGFKRAFTAILDSNITTLIAAVVLYCFGMGTIVGFATTLGLGVVISMFTVLVVSRFMLYRLVDMNIKSLKAYGVKGGKEA